ncbi:MAG: hypothetical protein ACRC1M_04200 [Methanobacteriaceae archaeon]
MEKLVKKIIRCSLEELETMDLIYEEFFGLEILNNEVKYEFLLKLSKENKNLICMGSGATPRTGPKALSPPIFNRFSWNNEFEESVIYYNDPTLYLDDEITVGWGVGTDKEYYLETIAIILNKIIKKLELNKNNVLFYSSSGGGFKSIQLATLIKGPIALVNNPQLILKNFSPWHFNNMKRACFNDMAEEEIIKNYNYRLNVLEMFKKEDYVPKIIYYVNSGSSDDIENQLIPFIKELKKLNFAKNEISIHIYRDEEVGHSPLNKEDSIKIIKKASRDYLYNNSNEYNIDLIKSENKKLKKALKIQKSRKIVKLVDNINGFKNKILKK